MVHGFDTFVLPSGRFRSPFISRRELARQRPPAMRRPRAKGASLRQATTVSKFRIPKGALILVKEVARHLLRRPVVGIVAAARTRGGRWLLVRRADVGEWALPGGTLEWGETLRATMARELEEEAGVVGCEIVRLVGVFSRSDRDPRFHAVTVVVECLVEPPVRAPDNPLEITEVGLFAQSELPPLATGMQDMLDAALRFEDPLVE
jgi:8-oxo-dGTP diphosphatase